MTRNVLNYPILGIGVLTETTVYDFQISLQSFTSTCTKLFRLRFFFRTYLFQNSFTTSTYFTISYLLCFFFILFSSSIIRTYIRKGIITNLFCQFFIFIDGSIIGVNKVESFKMNVSFYTSDFIQKQDLFSLQSVVSSFPFIVMVLTLILLVILNSNLYYVLF